MKVLCVIDVDEDRLKTITADDLHQYEFDSAFALEMRWVGNSGIKLDGFVYLSDQEASDILISHM